MLLDPIQKRVADNLMRPFADRKFKDWEKRFNKDRRVKEEEVYKQLRNPEFATNLGLPAHLPASTRKILKRTMTLASIPYEQFPSREKIYKRYGID